MKRNSHILIIAFILLSCFVFLDLVSSTQSHADSTSPPSWVENPPTDADIYYGIGVVSTRKKKSPSEEEKTKAYNHAVTELSQMAGQLIYSSFRDYQRETKLSPEKNVAEGEVVSSIKTISENFLQGIEIRGRWQDARTKQYYVFVTIDRKDANRQIKENIAARETKLQKVIDMGIKRIDQRLEKMQADMDRVDDKVGKMDRKVSNVDERVSDLFVQMQFVKDKIESLNSGEINWSLGLVRVKGVGLANPNFPPALQKHSAERAARIDAQAKLVELTNDLKIKVSTMTKNYMLIENTTIREFEGTLSGARQVGKTIFNDDGTAEVIMEANVK